MKADVPVVLVTGAGRGAGRRAAEAFGARGVRVAVNDINPDSVAETAAAVRRNGGWPAEYVVDVSRKFAVQTMINQIEDDWGRIDLLVHNARVSPTATLLDLDEWDWRRTIDVNLTGAFLMIQIAARVMRAAGGGTILIVEQDAEIPSQQGKAAWLASRAGLVGLREQATLELQPAGIRVAAVSARDLGDPRQAAALADSLFSPKEGS